jgi:polyhydroxybutyrate depolymerase
VLDLQSLRRHASLWGLASALVACAAPMNAIANDELHTLDFGGRTRSYILHLPPAISSGKPLPLVINLHGGGGNARSAMEQTGFNDEADRNGFIVVYPNGTGAPHPLLNAMGRGEFYSWNAGSCCGYAVQHQVDDVGFIRALIATLEQQYPIDRKRIYATGISNGGMMAYRLACELSDTIAAIGVVSGALVTPSCRPAQPVPVIHFHGTADQNVPMLGGVGPKSVDKTPKPPVMDAIDFWVKRDGALAQPQITRLGSITKRVYAAANGSAEVVFYLIQGGGHAWPGGKQMLSILDKPTQEISATQLIWQFFAAHPKP